MSSKSIERKVLASSVVLKIILLCPMSVVYAANWYVEPSIALATGYDDNPLLLSAESTNTAGEVVEIENQSHVTLRPTVIIATETERNSLLTTISSDIRRYSDSSLDSELFDVTSGYRRSNLTNEYGFDFSYIEDSTLETEFLDSGEFELDVNRTELSFAPVFISQISTIVTSETSLSFRKVTFDSINSDLTEFEETGASFELTNATTERLDLSALVRFLSFRPTDVVLEGELSKERSYALIFGAEYSLRENLVLEMSIGPEYTESFLKGEDDSDRDSSSTLYDLGFSYTGFTSSFSGSVSRSIDSSALGGLIETDRYTIGWRRPEVYGGELGASISFSSRDNAELALTNRDLYQFQLTYEKNLTRALQYLLLYRYRKEEFSGELQGGESNAAMFQLQYNWARKSFSN